LLTWDFMEINGKTWAKMDRTSESQMSPRVKTSRNLAFFEGIDPLRRATTFLLRMACKPDFVAKRDESLLPMTIHLEPALLRTL